MYRYPDPTDYGDPRFPNIDREDSDEYPHPPLGHSYTPPPAMNGGDRIMFPMSRWVPPYGIPVAVPPPLNEHQCISPAMNERGWEVRGHSRPQVPVTHIAPLVSPTASLSPPLVNRNSPPSQYHGRGVPNRNHVAVQFVHQHAPPAAVRNTTQPSLEYFSNMRQSLDSIEKGQAQSSTSMRKSVLLQQAQSAKRPPVGVMTAGRRQTKELPIHTTTVARAHHGTSVNLDDRGSTASPSPPVPSSNHGTKVASPSPPPLSQRATSNTPSSSYLPLRLGSNTHRSEPEMPPDAVTDNNHTVKRVHFLDDPVSDFREVTRLPRSHFGQLNASAPMGALIEDDEIDGNSERIGGRVLRKRK